MLNVFDGTHVKSGVGIGSTAFCSDSMLFPEPVSDVGRGVNVGGQGDKVG